MKKIQIVLLMLFLPLALQWGYAQNNEMQRAQELLDFLIVAKGDSVHTRLNEAAARQLPPDMIVGLFGQLEQQFGKYQSKGGWKTANAAGTTIYYCDIKFEKGSLRFLTAFDADGKANTIRFVPAPVTTSAVRVSNDKLEESDIHVCTGSFKLPGTLTLPKGKGGEKFPVVILVHGSGPNDRDETIGPNKPFRDIAWGLAERGIATIRYDKRTKVYGAAFVPVDKEPTVDYETVDDAVAAVELVKTIPVLDANHIYVLGHSLGGMLAPRIADRTKNLAGIVILAGNARPLADLLLEQIEYLASLSAPSAEASKQVEDIEAQVANLRTLGTEAFNEKIPLPLNLPRSYWLSLQDYNQVVVAQKLSLPIFILQGERDYQVTMKDFSLWRSGLESHPNVSFKAYPKLNHLLQEGSGKSIPAEYNQAMSVPGYVLDDIAVFVNRK